MVVFHYWPTMVFAVMSHEPGYRRKNVFSKLRDIPWKIPCETSEEK